MTNGETIKVVLVKKFKRNFKKSCGEKITFSSVRMQMYAKIITKVSVQGKERQNSSLKLDSN